MKKSSKAFTLIELMVVLLIIAVSLTILFPRLNTGSDQHSLLRASVNRIVSITEYAQQQAACTHLIHFLNIDRQKGIYWITSKNSAGANMPGTSLQKLSGQLPLGIKFADVKFQGIKSNLQNTAVISFGPQGWADPAEISVTCANGEIINIMIDEFSGQVATKEMN